MEYFAYIVQQENFLIDSFETYQKQSFRNRCIIYTEKGGMLLSVPVTKPFGNRTQTHQIRIMNAERWKLNHWRAIYSAYQNSPFFLYYKDELESVFELRSEYLLQLNNSFLNICNQLIGIKKEINLTKAFIPPGQINTDHRFDISPKSKETFSLFPPYTQVFKERFGFIPNLSILDLLFNLGPESLAYLKTVK